MTYPMQSDDPLAPSLLPPAADGVGLAVRYRTGRVVEWSSQTGWQVEVDGVTITDPKVLGGPWVAQIRRGDYVSLLSTVDQRGVATYMVLGHVLSAEQAVQIYG